MLKPLKKKSLATGVYEQLRDHIVSGDVEVGASLPSERVLSEQLGVNRAAVREGLKRLEQAGLVAIQQGGPTRVLDFKRTAGLEILGSMWVSSTGRIRTGVVRSVVEMRSALAPEVGRMAARRCTPEQAKRLANRVVEMRQQGDNLEVLQDLAMEFWGEVIDIGDNLAFQLSYNSLQATYGLVQRQLTQVLAPELTAFDEYAAVARAVGEGDTEEAARASAAIVNLGAQALQGVLAALDDVQEKK